MKNQLLSTLCFYLGIISIALSIILWGWAPNLTSNGFDAITDPALREALRSAHAERWGIFVGLWPATLLILSRHLDPKI
jgi:hypothetical protein